MRCCRRITMSKTRVSFVGCNDILSSRTNEVKQTLVTIVRFRPPKMDHIVEISEWEKECEKGKKIEKKKKMPECDVEDCE